MACKHDIPSRPELPHDDDRPSGCAGVLWGLVATGTVALLAWTVFG